VSWERLPVLKIDPAVHRTLEETSGPTAGHQIEQRGSIYIYFFFDILLIGYLITGTNKNQWRN
jgi:hypothetical protein